METDPGVGWIGTDSRRGMWTIVRRTGVPPQVRFLVEGRNRVPAAAPSLAAGKALASQLRFVKSRESAAHGLFMNLIPLSSDLFTETTQAPLSPSGSHT